MNSHREIGYILVEDEPPIRQNLISKIGRLAPDFKLEGEASGGKSAQELLKACRPDILFTDIRMPGMDGIELMNYLKEHHPDILIVVISGYSDFSYAQQSIRAGVSDYLLKPIEIGQLQSCLDKLRSLLLKRDQLIDSEIEWYEDSAGRNLACQTADLIKEHFREPLSIQSIAEKMHVNPTYLSRTFKEVYGRTPSRFLQEQRIELAKRLLTQYPQMEIKEISVFTGYPDQNYFSRVFKKETGLSPLEFRN